MKEAAKTTLKFVGYALAGIVLYVLARRNGPGSLT